MREDHVIELRDVEGRLVRVKEGEAVRALAVAMIARSGGQTVSSSVLVPGSKIANLTIEPIEAKS